MGLQVIELCETYVPHACHAAAAKTGATTAADDGGVGWLGSFSLPSAVLIRVLNLFWRHTSHAGPSGAASQTAI
jgi:hypothetical protein